MPNLVTPEQKAERIYEMAFEGPSDHESALDVEAVFRFLGGPCTGSWHTTARMVVHFAHTMGREAAIAEIARAVERAEGPHFRRT